MSFIGYFSLFWNVLQNTKKNKKRKKNQLHRFIIVKFIISKMLCDCTLWLLLHEVLGGYMFRAENSTAEKSRNVAD